MPMNYAYCLRQHNDHPLDHVFVDEDTSGKVYPFLEREAAKQLMAVVKPGDHVLVHKLDRLGFNTVDILDTIRMFMNREVHLHVLDFGGQVLHMEGATGLAMVAVQAMFMDMQGHGPRVRPANLKLPTRRSPKSSSDS